MKILAEFPRLAAYDDQRFQAFTMTLDDGRFVVITNTGGMGFPTDDDFLVCVYTTQSAFGDDPTDSLLSSGTSDDFGDMESALSAVAA
jgi:hypothetical protein